MVLHPTRFGAFFVSAPPVLVPDGTRSIAPAASSAGTPVACIQEGVPTGLHNVPAESLATGVFLAWPDSIDTDPLANPIDITGAAA